jgi:hypothetical protein
MKLPRGAHVHELAPGLLEEIAGVPVAGRDAALVAEGLQRGIVDVGGGHTLSLTVTA